MLFKCEQDDTGGCHVRDLGADRDIAGTDFNPGFDTNPQLFTAFVA